MLRYCKTRPSTHHRKRLSLTRKQSYVDHNKIDHAFSSFVGQPDTCQTAIQSNCLEGYLHRAVGRVNSVSNGPWMASYHGAIAAAITIIWAAIVAARFVIDVLTTDVNELTEQITQLTAQQIALTRQRTGLNAELSYNTIVYNNEESVIASLIEDENALIAEIIKLDKKVREAVSGSIIESLITVRDEKMGRLTRFC